MTVILRRVLAVAAGIAAATLPAASAARAQESPAASLQVRTFNLHNLSPVDAARLVSPYVVSRAGGVYEVGGNVQAITVRETPAVIARIDSVLREHDHPRRTLVLRFQLVAAIDSSATDPSLRDIEPPLRNLFRFAGYRLVAEGTATASEYNEYSLTMSGGGVRYQVDGSVEGVEVDDGKPSVRLQVSLHNSGPNEQAAGPHTAPGPLFRTGLTTALGTTLVVGTAAGGDGARALILVVRPDQLGDAGNPRR